MTEWSIEFSPKAEKELFSFAYNVSDRIMDKLKETRANPQHYFERLKGRTDYKLRIGDYRVVADINESEMLIWVTKVGHRRNVYER